MKDILFYHWSVDHTIVQEHFIETATMVIQVYYIPSISSLFPSNGPDLMAISCKIILKEYTSPF